jgi:hypothetical protein
MKTLTIKEPWATLIIDGIKDVENRTWRTNYRGKILIHTSKKVFNYFRHVAFNTDQYIDIVHGYGASSCNYDKIFDKELIYGAIIGEVELVDVIRGSESVWSESECWHWLLKNPMRYDKPVLNVKGKLSLWDYNEITKINYKKKMVMDVDMCSTLCPIRQYFYAGTILKVGSYRCCDCKNHINIDRENLIVYCNNRGIK